MSENTNTYEIVEYNGVVAALNAIVANYEGRVYDVTTREGMADARTARREIREVRTGLERKRKEIKEPALRHCQLIDAEAKMITTELRRIEDPIHEMITTEEQRAEKEKQEKERLDAERVKQIKARIDALIAVPAWGAKAADILLRLRELREVEIDETFAEFGDEAAVIKEQAITRLSTMHAEAVAAEAEREALRKQAAESDKRLAEERAQNEARLIVEQKKAEAERDERIEAQKKLYEAAVAEQTKLAEEARAARESQENERQAAAAAQRRAAEHEADAKRNQALAESKCETAESALMEIKGVVRLWDLHETSGDDAMESIALIVDANT